MRFFHLAVFALAASGCGAGVIDSSSAPSDPLALLPALDETIAETRGANASGASAINQRIREVFASLQDGSFTFNDSVSRA